MSMSPTPFEPKKPNTYDPRRLFRRQHCKCNFRQGKPGEISRCECGHWWRAAKHYPFRWKPVSKGKVYKIWRSQLHGDVFEKTYGE